MRPLALLVLAALLEVVGDAAIRVGLVRSPWWLIAGAGCLIAYGIAVNANSSMEFGRLLGVYIAVFFVVSQIVSVVVFGERPPPSRLVGGALIVLGGIVVQAGSR